jgi:hypothetical protein
MAKHFQEHFDIYPDIITTYGPELVKYTTSFRLHPDRPQAKATMVNENILKDSETHPTGHHTRNSQHAGEAVPPVLTPKMIKLLQHADVLVSGTLLPNYSPAYVEEMLPYTKPTYLTVLIVQGYLRQVSQEGHISIRDFSKSAAILPMFNIAVLSTDDHPNALELAKQWKKEAPDTHIVVTQGPIGG